jgi:hypothetical protein
MRPHPPWVVVAGAALAAVLASHSEGSRVWASPSVKPEAPASVVAPDAPVVALLSGRPGADTTSLFWAQPGAAQLPAAAAVLSHLHGAVVRGATSADGSVFVTADTDPSRDRSFGSSLFWIPPGQAAKSLCDRVVHGSRPLVSADGRVFVSRGIAGSTPADPRALRVDQLTIDEIDPATGSARTVIAHTGYLAFLAGLYRGALLVYRVDARGADLVSVEPSTGAISPVIPAMIPFARDFSIDEAGGALVYQTRHPTDPRRWVVERVDLASGARTTVTESAASNLVPFIYPSGRIEVAGAGSSVDWIRAVSGPSKSDPAARWLAALRLRPGELPHPHVIDARDGTSIPVPFPPGERATVAGFKGASSSGQVAP